MRRWSVLALLVVAQFMVVLDISVVNVALPSIGRALRIPAASLSWVVTAYVLASGGLLLAGGRLADLVGRRAAFMVGLGTFTLASLACGLADGEAPLIAARAVQGTGAALMTPAALALVTTTYAGADRATALSVWGAVASAGIAVGVIAGGALTTWLSWEWVFLVNVPVGATALALAPRVLPRAPADTASGGALRDLDLPGALTAVTGLVALVYAISGAADHGWTSARTLALGAAAPALLAAFVLIERRAPRPLLAPAVWRTPTVGAGALFLLAATGLMTGAFFLVSLHLQRQLGWSALRTGLAFLPFVAAITLGVHATAKAIGHLGTRALIAAGLLLAAAGDTVLAAGGSGYATTILPGLLVFGLGVGLAFPAIQIGAMSDVAPERAGATSGLLSTAHELGAALGVAVLASVGASGGAASAYTTAAVTAGVLALLALVAVPAVRPEPGSAPGHGHAH
jgi:EmrB/QacA subfamily drug resistance transporter